MSNATPASPISPSGAASPTVMSIDMAPPTPPAPPAPPSPAGSPPASSHPNAATIATAITTLPHIQTRIAVSLKSLPPRYVAGRGQDNAAAKPATRRARRAWAWAPKRHLRSAVRFFKVRAHVETPDQPYRRLRATHRLR